MTEESMLVDNIINKINIYMQKNKQTLFNLAAHFGFAYQPFYKLVTNRGLPNLSSLAMLASSLGYKIDELVSDKVIIELNGYNKIEDIKKASHAFRAKIYLAADKYLSMLEDEFIALRTTKNNVTGVDVCKIFTIANSFDIDGEYIVKYQEKETLINIIGVSSKFVFVEQNDGEIKIPLTEIIPICKFFCNSIIYENETNYITGLKL